MGDPSGIGPEVTLKALASPKISGFANFFVIGDGFVMKKTSSRLGIKLDSGLIDLHNVEPSGFSYGKNDPAFGKASVEYIDKALELLKGGIADALVTAPINKKSVISSGLAGFEGHTEYLALKTKSKKFAMMFVGSKLKVILVTRHVALGKVGRRLSESAIDDTIALGRQYLRKYFKIASPKMGVCGLNPHAGESGSYGDEETLVIGPAVKKANRRFKNISGPLPADVAFYDALKERYDCVVAMYHDQGLIPFKMLHFKDGVNMTLGLPFVRTSPDHGTAFNISGKGIADPTSMIEAIKLACSLKAS